MTPVSSDPWVLITHDSWTAGVGSPHCCLYHQPDLGCLVISGRVDRHSDPSQPTGTSWLTVFTDALFFFFFKSFFCQVEQWYLWRLKTFLPVEVCKDCCSVLIKAFGGLTHSPDDVQSMSKACWRLNYYSLQLHSQNLKQNSVTLSNSSCLISNYSNIFYVTQAF